MQSLVTFADTQNPTWDYLGVSNWSVVEINVGIICTCMPALRVMLVRLFPALGGTIGKSNKYYAQSGSNNAGKSKGRSRAGTGGQMPSIVHYPEPATTGGQQKQGTIYQQRTYTVQYGDDDNSDQQNLVHMQSLDFKGHKASRASEVSL